MIVVLREYPNLYCVLISISLLILPLSLSLAYALVGVCTFNGVHVH